MVLKICFDIFDKVMPNYSSSLNLLKFLNIKRKRESVVELPKWAYDKAIVLKPERSPIFRNLNIRVYQFDKKTGYLTYIKISEQENRYVFHNNYCYIHMSGYLVSENGTEEIDSSFVNSFLRLNI